MKILSIIPARGGSVEIPFKNLTKLGGKPLLHYTVKASLGVSAINKTVVSTDNEKISNYAKKLGAEVIKRPKKISGNKIGLEPSLIHTVKFLEKEQNFVPDVIITLQNTSPFRNSKHIESALKFFKKNNFDSVFSGFKTHHLMWKMKGKFGIPTNYNLLDRPNRQQIKNQFIENGAIYITKFPLFKKNKYRISGKIGLFEMPEELSVQIDSKLDLKIAEQIIKK